MAVGALAAAVAIPLIASKVAHTQPTASGQDKATTAAGLRAFKDPVTGEFREPDAAEAQALGSAVGTTGSPRAGRTERIEERTSSFQIPGGGVAARLDDSHLSFTVAKIGPDGKLTYECVQGGNKARESLHTPAAPVSRHRHGAEVE